MGVYNNDVYIKEDASFEVSARWASEPVDGFCPADCNKPNGNCRNFGSGPTCQCEEGFGGKLCEGKSVVVELGAVVAGALDPADWVYYRLTVDSRNYRKWKEGLVVDFTTNDKGHPVLILKRDSYPSMLDNDYIFTSSQMLQGRKRFKLDETELPDGEYIFGIFNMDYYRHEQMEYKFMVSSPASNMRVSGMSTLPFPYAASRVFTGLKYGHRQPDAVYPLHVNCPGCHCFAISLSPHVNMQTPHSEARALRPCATRTLGTVCRIQLS